MSTKLCVVILVFALFFLAVNADKSIESEVRELKELFGESNDAQIIKTPVAPKTPTSSKKPISTPTKAGPVPSNSNEPTDADWDQLNALAEQTQTQSSDSAKKQEVKLEKAGKDYVGDGLGTPKKLVTPTKAEYDAMYYGTALGMAGLVAGIFVVGAVVGLVVAYVKAKRAALRKATSGDLYQAM